MEIELLALELQKVFHEKEYKTYWEEKEAIKECLNSYDIDTLGVQECPNCETLLEDGVCPDVGNHGCQYQA